MGVCHSGVSDYLKDGLIYGCPYVFDGDHYLKFKFNGTTTAGNFNLHVLFAHVSFLRTDATNGLDKITINIIRS